MSKILDAAAAYLEDRGWVATPFKALRDTLRLRFETKGVEWFAYAQSKEDDTIFLFYCVSPENAPPERRAACAEFLARMNFHLRTGVLEMDWKDGEIRFRTGIDFRGEPPTRPLIRGVVEESVSHMHQYLPVLLAVMHGERTAESAAEEMLSD